MALVQLQVNLTGAATGNSVRYVLDGTPYEFIFKYNGTGDVWVLDLLDDSGEVLLAGKALVVGTETSGDEVLDLLSEVRYKAVPPGRLFAFDTSRQARESGLEEIDRRVVLLYEEGSD